MTHKLLLKVKNKIKEGIEMNIESYFLEKMSNILFVEIKAGNSIGGYNFKENVYLPIKGDEIVDKTKQGDDLKNIPISMFVEGMFYTIAIDKNFRLNSTYMEILNILPEAIKYIKGVIFKNVKEEKYEDAYILLKGLLKVEFKEENLDKAFLLISQLKTINSIFNDEETWLIEEGKKLEKYPLPFYYDALLKRDKKDYEGALYDINQYLAFGGKETNEVSELKSSLSMVHDFEEAKSLVYNKPKEAIKKFVPLLDVMGDSPEVFYNIAVAYRLIDNYEKAIYYLNEALAINDDYLEAINEIGIDYASLGDYENAVAYFRKIFEVTKSIEVCTNLVMCYLNMGDKKQAKIHFEIAEKMDPNDEIVQQLKNIID